ncbi:MAG TPA: aminoglycoside adenylyltransferase domain-containing protein, partial [Ktedonobacteraceae bacterium]|nr:aminoglycoside adenylyltransferase domain-containing protein [Ktedonobacteraceae bacterium]
RNDPSWLEWVRQREEQAFVVLTLCRLLYTLDITDVVSKPAAAHWAQKALGERWAGLIERALAGQHEDGEISDSEMEDTIALIEYTVERSQR